MCKADVSWHIPKVLWVELIQLDNFIYENEKIAYCGNVINDYDSRIIILATVQFIGCKRRYSGSLRTIYHS